MARYLLPDGTEEHWSKEGLHSTEGPAVIRSDGTREYWTRGQRHRLDGPAYERRDGSFSYWQNGKLHRADGPAVSHADGFLAYYHLGMLHRTDGPALIYPNGTQVYLQNNVVHRTGGPAVIRPDDRFDNWHQGQEEYWQNGRLHRRDGPAISHKSGYKAYYQKGKLHRTDGPARLWPDGSCEYYENGVLLEDERGGRAEEISKQDMVSFYETGTEDQRLHGRGFPSLEFARAREIIFNHLPRENIQIADIGGGPGVYSSWLAALGHDVVLVEPVPEHIRQAEELARGGASFEAVLGDALRLPLEDESVDFIVMFGPLYHLQDDQERQQAICEAWRVLRPGGKAIVSTLNRHVPFVQGLLMNLFDLPSYKEAVAGAGPIFKNSAHPMNPRAEWFEVAYAHSPTELRRELEAVGFSVEMVTGKEGPAWIMLSEAKKRMQNADQREDMLFAAREADAFEELAAMSSHLLAVVTKSGKGES